MEKFDPKDKQSSSSDDVRQDMVEITIKNQPYQIHRGHRKVSEIKQIGGINPNHILVQVTGGNLVDLPNDGAVTIKGGEIFQSKPPVGDNS
jgi:hypothetical protein